jgi:hypothetical protein
MKEQKDMAKIHIIYEEFDPEEDSILIDGELKTKLYIGPSEYEDYDEKTKQFLFEFLCKQNHFPIFLTFEPFDDLTDELEKTFKKEKIQYFKRMEGKESNRKPFPVFKVIICDPQSLKIALEETFWFASANQFYALSFSDNINYKLRTVKGLWRKEKKVPLPHFNMKDTSTIITIWHDGQGFNIYTNDLRYSSIEALTQHLPNGTIVENG